MRFLETVAHLFHPRRSNRHRARVLHPAALSKLSVLALAFWGLIRVLSVTPIGGGVLGFASNISVQQVIDQTNAQRSSAGLSPLSVNGTLNQAALLKANDMFANQYWAHNSPQGKQPWDFMRQAGYRYSVAGENLARDFGDTGSMMSAWMASPTHRANIVNDKYREIGVAVVNGTLQGVETTLVVQMFGTPSGAQPQVAAGTTVQQVAAAERPAPSPAVPFRRPASPAPASETPAPVVVQEPVASPVAEPATLTAAPITPQLVGDASLTRAPLFTPLQISKAFFLAVVMLIILTLMYDTVVVSHRTTLRFVGKNFAHLLLLLAVVYILIFFKGGIIQ
jgi:hypothetical protein